MDWTDRARYDFPDSGCTGRRGVDVFGMTSEEAKAVTETAKTAGKIVDAAAGTGSYLARIVASIPDDVLGLTVGDCLHHKRKRNLARREADTATILDNISCERITDPSQTC